MRISTNQIYGNGVLGMERNQNQVVRLQNQMSSGRRMLTPADDPVAAAQVLAVTQAREVAVQYARNQGDATDRLGLVDSQLNALTDLLQSVRSRTVQAANTILTDSDRQAIATELEQHFDQMLGIANSRSAEGDFLFSGYQGATTPFARSAGAGSETSISYFGDDGQRLLQVASSQQMASNITGSDLFMNIPQGNGSFATAASGNGPGLPNQGSGVFEAGSVLDPQKWQSALSSGFTWQGTGNRQLQIVFSSVAGVRSYQLFDASTPDSSGADLPRKPVGAVLPFTPGQAIPLLTTSADFGAQVVITGSPADGDSFAVTPSTNKSVFQTVQEMIELLRSPVTSSTARTAFSGELQAHLGNLDQALVNVGRVQATVGARMQVLDGLSNNATAVDIQYQQTLSDLQDLDYAAAIADFTRQQVSLEAAQKSFVAISGLSLFKYI